MASVTVPLLSEHKIEFVRNRALETILGGIRIFFGSSVPPFVYTLQIIVHQLPMLIGSLFTILAEVSSLSLPLAALSCGVLILLLSGIGHILNFLLHRNASPVQKLKESVNPTLESDVTVFESCFSLHTARTLFPRKKFFVNVFLHSLICGVLIGYGIIYLSPSRLYKLYGQAEVVYLIFLLSWITICVGVYSLTVYAPPETATFRLLDHWEIKPLMRPFYIALFFGIDLIFW